MIQKTISIFLMAMSLSLFIACSGDDNEFLGKGNQYEANQAGLYQKWQLIGYGSEGKFHMIDEEFRKVSEKYGYRFWVDFHPDGTYDGRDAINTLNGEYTCKDNQIKIEEICSTEIFDKNKESKEFHKLLQNVSSYGIKGGKKLRLYYSANEFLYFEPIEEWCLVNDY